MLGQKQNVTDWLIGEIYITVRLFKCNKDSKSVCKWWVELTLQVSFITDELGPTQILRISYPSTYGTPPLKASYQ